MVVVFAALVLTKKISVKARHLIYVDVLQHRRRIKSVE